MSSLKVGQNAQVREDAKFLEITDFRHKNMILSSFCISKRPKVPDFFFFFFFFFFFNRLKKFMAENGLYKCKTEIFPEK